MTSFSIFNFAFNFNFAPCSKNVKISRGARLIGAHLFLEGKIRPPGQKFNLDFNILNLGRKYIMYKKINNIRYIPAILHILK